MWMQRRRKQASCRLSLSHSPCHQPVIRHSLPASVLTLERASQVAIHTVRVVWGTSWKMGHAFCGSYFRISEHFMNGFWQNQNNRKRAEVIKCVVVKRSGCQHTNWEQVFLLADHFHKKGLCWSNNIYASLCFLVVSVVFPPAPLARVDSERRRPGLKVTAILNHR